MREGVTKFTADHRDEVVAARDCGAALEELVAWREILMMTQLVGRDPERYEGTAYGNISARIGAPSSPRGRRRFLISGTQTGGRTELGLADFCVVEEYEAQRNWVRSRGQIAPSSESMTHGAIYDLSPRIRTVLHAHSPTIWRARTALRLPTTASSVDYGTPAMAREIERLHRTTGMFERRVLAMGGHEDGVIAFGHSAEQAGTALIQTLARALQS